MPQYVLVLDAHAMDHIPDEDMPDVDKAAHAVSQEAIDAGVWLRPGNLGTWIRPQDRRDAPSGSTRPVSYTHLTLPTTPYV